MHTNQIAAARHEEVARLNAEQRITSALIRLANILGEAITAAGESGIPSGHLYAMVTGVMPLETYNAAIRILIGSGAVRQSNHLLKSASFA